jgi:osmoprotectant transport system substrate-binding protein
MPVSGQGARWRRGLLVVTAAAVALTALAFWPAAGSAAALPGHAPGTALVVGSFNFPESELLAAVYALALMQAGIPARLQLGLGSRERVQSALAAGIVDVVPEYLGAALASLEPAAAAAATSDPVAVRRELARALAPWQVRVLRPAAAQNQDALAVTRATAAQLRLRTVSDLGPLAPQMVLAGAPECPQRPSCLPGLRRVYGLQFARFVPLATEQERIDVLRQGAADVVVTGTTGGHLASGDLVLLADDRQLQPPGNVVPVVRAIAIARYPTRLVGALDAVSARLTTADLAVLNRRITAAGTTVLAEARAWLEQQGILPGLD